MWTQQSISVNQTKHSKNTVAELLFQAFISKRLYVAKPLQDTTLMSENQEDF